MPRLIDANEALEIIDNYKKSISITAKTEPVISAIEDIVRFICPAIDAKPVVRCKDCKYRNNEYSEQFCEVLGRLTNDKFYCSYGTKVDEDKCET